MLRFLLFLFLSTLLLVACSEDPPPPAPVLVYEDSLSAYISTESTEAGESLAVYSDALTAYSDTPDTGLFTHTISKPAWFDAVDDVAALEDEHDVSTLWRSAPRCCNDKKQLLRDNRVFYKACYNAILRHPEDDALVVKCLWLMDAGADRDQVHVIERYLLDHYADHRNSVDGCVNCMPGDTVARVSLGYAQHERRDGKTRSLADARVRATLEERGEDISLWVQAEMLQTLGKWYLEDGASADQQSFFNTRFESLDQARADNEALAKRFTPLQDLHTALNK